ncbi:helix-turn-helix transcriptional regulator [Ligilactobacillus pabuli]|uniref:helix-turn-helix transcriptional regulator n=1 Tax=Ligilactobacillus pabuli TaxID=2886039 RepID=UPI0035A22DF0
MLQRLNQHCKSYCCGSIITTPNQLSQQLAASANISVRECQRYFAKNLHTSPSKYIIHYRILTAARMLLESELSVTEISSRCGFNSPSYFTKTFKSTMNVTPLQFRNDHLQA